MQERLVDIFISYQEFAVVISLLLNIVISVFGVIPSVFLTAANLLVFGIWKGTFLSFLGEVLGAIVAFWLYRKGFKRFTDRNRTKYRFIRTLLSAKGKEAFFLILLLRLFPFIPSGLVTFTAAVGEVSLLLFIIASSIGKVPAMIIEVYSVYQVTAGTLQGKIILTVVSIIGLAYVFLKLVKKDTRISE